MISTASSHFAAHPNGAPNYTSQLQPKMNSGDPKQPRFQVNDFVHASTVPLISTVQPPAPSHFFGPKAGGFTSSQRAAKADEAYLQPFQAGLSLPADQVYTVVQIDKAKTDKEDHIYYIEPICADQIRFQTSEKQMLATTKGLGKNEQAWYYADTGRELVKVLGHTVKRRDETYDSPALKQARAGRPGEADLVARIIFEDPLSKKAKEDDADKFSRPNDWDINSAFVMV